MEQEKINPDLSSSNNRNWIKLLISCFIFFLSFTYVTDNIQRIFPLNYFESEEYASSVNDFMSWFYDTKIELPKLQIPFDEITVSNEEILDAKINPYNYETTYDEETGEEILISTLSDEEIIEKIRYEKYRHNQNEIENYNFNRYYAQDTFYYQITDRDGVTYTNLPDQSVSTLDTVNIPTTNSNGLSGTLYLPASPLGNSVIHQNLQHYNDMKLFVLAGVLITLLSCIPIRSYYKKIKGTEFVLPESIRWIEEKYKALPIEIKGFIFLCSFVILKDFNLFSYWNLNYLLYHWFSALSRIIFMMIVLCSFMVQVKELIYLIKHPQVIRKEWSNGLYHSNKDDLKDLPIYRKVFTKVILYTVFIGAWGIIIGASFMSFGAMVLIGIPSVGLAFILLMIIKKRSKSVQAISDTLSKMAKGEVTSDIHVKGDGLVNDIAQNINKVREGVIISNQKQSNSERLKTELITNVSHDLRTPLTSILNYVDLAKREDITSEERKEYIEIIDTKSKRLKILIDDLFEASKMASGAVELYKEQVDLVSLMHQSIAEYEDRFEEHQLTLRTKTSDHHMYAYCDGRKMYRVFENLLNNVVKYAQPGTRVYLEMLYEGTEIVITLKNISNYELGFDIVELTERFKRADSSRHTEGSGLGLAIVKSILELHGAGFDLSQDGDLFKVMIRIKKI